ncbi:pyrazinamidase/nicotinamidase [Gymnopilus junonius]|uniref:nicotinamidase n=1 Tax=Gymnopilus junonius TaxID=109634 RepID=A0A9P5NZS9_GYMJU|nr:pyrazinamidase/nicotinamidase [Gymnopilus junonius]
MTQPKGTELQKSDFSPALIVIDMQNDFVSGSLAVPGGDTVIDNVNSLIDLPFKVRVATRDFHPQNHVSFADTHKKELFSKKEIYHPEDKAKEHGIEQVLWPVHCVAHTPGADFVPGLETTQFDIIILKGVQPEIESYSAFRDIWGRGETELPGFLKEKGITDVYFVGLAGDFCVKFTAIDAADYGFKAWVVTDATKSIAQDDAHFTEMASKGVKFTTTKEVQEALRS